MSAADYLGTYAEGWIKGDANTILKVVTDGYTFDDPNAGKITKSKFAEYLSEVKETVRSLRGGKVSDTLIEFSDIVTKEDQGIMTAWCWWAIPGTDLKGSGLIKIGADGVRSEVITYYAKPSA